MRKAKRGHMAALSFLDAVQHHPPAEDLPRSQAALARACGETPQNFHRAIRGDSATLERVSRWIERWPGDLALVVTSSYVGVFKRSDVEGNHG